MLFKDALDVAYQIPWSKNSTFEVYFAWNYSMLNNVLAPTNVVYYDNDVLYRPGNVLGWNIKDNERLSLHLKDLTLPQISSEELNSWDGGRWARANGKPQQYTFSMTFMDSNQLEFYKMFAAQFREQSYRYFDDYSFNVFVSKDSDYGDRYHNDTTGFGDRSHTSTPLMSLKRCAIQAISAITFANTTENQILEFTVNFVANDIEIYDSGARQFYDPTSTSTRYNNHQWLVGDIEQY